MTNHRRYRAKSPPRQAGLTLVELMVALTVSLILLGGVVQIYSGSKTAYRMTENLSRLQENGRFAMEFLARDIRRADFWGCLGTVSNITNNLDPGGGSGYAPFTDGIDGTDGGGTLSDSITLAFASGTGLTVLTPFMINTAANLQVPAGNTLEQSDIVLVSDCTGGDIFQISNATPSSGVLVHNTGAATIPGNLNPGVCPIAGVNPHCLSQTYSGDARLYAARSVAYTVKLQDSDCDGTANVGAPPALCRNGNELVENVENMQVLYGEDTNADGVANRYVPAGTPNMNNVVSVRVALLLRSTDSVLPQNATQNHTLLDVAVGPTDRILRRVFSSTITLRNRAP